MIEVRNDIVTPHEFELAGWLLGECPGSGHIPMEHGRGRAESIVKLMQLECSRMRTSIAAYRAGVSHPELVEHPDCPPGLTPAVVAWCELHPEAQQEVLRSEIERMEAECEAGEQHVTKLRRLVHETSIAAYQRRGERRKVAGTLP
ncbi:MAG: hypothetical protein LBR05_08190 [Azoarcus sp.]|nr:hypothetical protein [Azoarcus sp.]